MYKRFLSNKSKVIKVIRKLKAETIFTRMIIIGTTQFIFVLLYNTASFIIQKINLLNGIQYTTFANLNVLVSYDILLLSIYIHKNWHQF